MSASGKSFLGRVEELLEVFLASRPDASSAEPEACGDLLRSFERADLLLAEVADSQGDIAPLPSTEPRTPQPEDPELSFALLDAEDSNPLATVCGMIQKRLLSGIRDLRLARWNGQQDRILTVIESTWHETLKGLIGVEAALREQQGLSRRDRSWIFLEESLQVRRLIGELRMIVLAGGEPEGTALDRRLEAVARHVESMRELPVYSRLRPQDRAQLECLVGRIGSWLAEGRPAEGRRLWQDLAAFVKLLRQINLREELVQHDREVLAELPRILGEREDRVPLAAHQLLRRLFGRDERLDLLLEHPHGFGVGDLHEIFPQLARERQPA